MIYREISFQFPGVKRARPEVQRVPHKLGGHARWNSGHQLHSQQRGIPVHGLDHPFFAHGHIPESCRRPRHWRYCDVAVRTLASLFIVYKRCCAILWGVLSWPGPYKRAAQPVLRFRGLEGPGVIWTAGCLWHVWREVDCELVRDEDVISDVTALHTHAH